MSNKPRYDTCAQLFKQLAMTIIEKLHSSTDNSIGLVDISSSQSVNQERSILGESIRINKHFASLHIFLFGGLHRFVTSNISAQITQHTVQIFFSALLITFLYYDRSTCVNSVLFLAVNFFFCNIQNWTIEKNWNNQIRVCRIVFRKFKVFFRLGGRTDKWGGVLNW